jgi:hypothetical protein
MTEMISRAEWLAADLAGARVDINEAQKALAYLRKARTPQQFFDYLRAIVRDGRAVIRSGQTLGYYRDLLAACERHLRGMDADRMAQTLGWAIRLLRYYRAFPQSAPSREVGATQPTAPARPATEPAPAPPRPQPAAPQLPEVGDIFTGRVLEVGEDAVVVEVPKFDPRVALGVIRTERLGGRQYQVNNPARVEVIGVSQKKGRTILELKPAPRRQG